MDKEDKQGLAILLTILFVLAGIIWGANTLINTQEGSCYDDVHNYSSWPTVKPELDKAAADGFLTLGECENLRDFYDEAYAEQNRKEALKDYAVK